MIAGGKVLTVGGGLILLIVACLRAASPVTEPFTAGLNGWTNSVSTNTWVSTNQMLRLSFPGALTPPAADLEGGPGASGGGFFGDFTAANVEAVGFSFLCESVNPSDLIIELRSGTNIFSQELAPRLGPVGTWNYLLCPLTGPGSARWAGFPGGDLISALTNIDRVAIRILASGTLLPQAYQLDDIFLDRLPAATSLGITGTNTTEVSWANLRMNFGYRMDHASSPTNAWSSLPKFVATSAVRQVIHTNATPEAPTFYRLLIP